MPDNPNSSLQATKTDQEFIKMNIVENDHTPRYLADAIYSNNKEKVLSSINYNFTNEDYQDDTKVS